MPCLDDPYFNASYPIPAEAEAVIQAESPAQPYPSEDPGAGSLAVVLLLLVLTGLAWFARRGCSKPKSLGSFINIPK
jgi:hypothetical protein